MQTRMLPTPEPSQDEQWRDMVRVTEDQHIKDEKQCYHGMAESLARLGILVATSELPEQEADWLHFQIAHIRSHLLMALKSAQADISFRDN